MDVRKPLLSNKVSLFFVFCPAEKLYTYLLIDLDFQTFWLLGLMFLTNGGLAYAGMSLCGSCRRALN